MESDDRLNFESALARWRASSAFDADTLDELESHLRDAVADGLTRGLSPAKAFREAVSQLGDATQLASEFSKLQQTRSSKIMNTSLLQSPRLRRLARNLAIAIAIIVPIRAFALAPYRAVGAEVAPEIRPGSRVLAWTIAPTFTPGDIAVYRKDDHAFLGRVAGVSASGIVIANNHHPEQTVPRDFIIGRVILTTR